MSQFVGKVALITGGNAGIGRAAAIEFAKQGAKVVVSGRREKEGNAVVAEIQALGGEAIFVTIRSRPVATSETLLFLTFLDFPDIDLFWHMRCSGSLV